MSYYIEFYEAASWDYVGVFAQKKSDVSRILHNRKAEVVYSFLI